VELTYVGQGFKKTRGKRIAVYYTANKPTIADEITRKIYIFTFLNHRVFNRELLYDLLAFN
jgi:hypothetical protein